MFWRTAEYWLGMTQEEDRALAEFRGFEHIAQAYIPLIEDAELLEKLDAIVASIQNALQRRKKVLVSE